MAGWPDPVVRYWEIQDDPTSTPWIFQPKHVFGKNSTDLKRSRPDLSESGVDMVIFVWKIKKKCKNWWSKKWIFLLSPEPFFSINLTFFVEKTYLTSCLKLVSCRGHRERSKSVDFFEKSYLVCILRLDIYFGWLARSCGQILGNPG